MLDIITVIDPFYSWGFCAMRDNFKDIVYHHSTLFPDLVVTMQERQMSVIALRNSSLLSLGES